jgi:UPF0176 protein
VSAPYEVLLYYNYFPVPNAERYVVEHRALCQELGLLGRILVAPEGINGTVSGLREQTQRYRALLSEEQGTEDMEFKVDPADGHVFQKLSIKARQEIVTLGLPGELDINPNQATGHYLSPKAFYEAMQDPNTIVLDGRNDYESELGRFRNALCPEVGNFRDFPQWIRDHRNLLDGKRILTYCTGGIRCEKLSGYLIQEGFEDVSQLHGGIVTYGRDPEVQGRDFDGSCYVFDQRIGVPVNQANPTIISHCAHCEIPCERYRNCGHKPCNAQFFCCPSCEEGLGRYCSEACRNSVVE